MRHTDEVFGRTVCNKVCLNRKLMRQQRREKDEAAGRRSGSQKHKKPNYSAARFIKLEGALS